MYYMYILDENEEPVECDDLRAWGTWFEKSDRTVAVDHIDRVDISTVFLGLNHNFRDIGAPELWETMIFGGRRDGYQNRYTSRADALAGHAVAVRLVVRISRAAARRTRMARKKRRGWA